MDLGQIISTRRSVGEDQVVSDDETKGMYPQTIRTEGYRKIQIITYYSMHINDITSTSESESESKYLSLPSNCSSSGRSCRDPGSRGDDRLEFGESLLVLETMKNPSGEVEQS